MTKRNVGVIVAAAIMAAGTVLAADVGIPGTVTALNVNTLSGKQKLKTVHKSSLITFGGLATTAQMSGQLEVFYVDTPGNIGTVTLPSPWAGVTATTAKFKNVSAPGGPTVVKSATVKAAKLAKVSAKGVGGISIATAPGPGGVVTVLTINNAAGPSSDRFCTLYAAGSGSQVTHKITGAGFKLTLKRGVPTACPNPPTCVDAIQNGSETDVDCGGGTCPVCANGDGCTVGGDCASGYCLSGVCSSPSCSDTVQNGTESDVDCGGGSCPACGPGSACGAFTDCDSLVCTGNICQAATCSDGVENGGESDVDCGGPCAGCPNGGGCGAGSDCQSLVCVGNLCQIPTCADGVENGAETDVDCGGGTCPDCPINDGCLINGDCLSNFCAGSLCKCPNQAFTFSITSNDGGSVDSAEWPGGAALLNGPTGCSVTANRPSDNIDLVGNLGDKFSINAFAGYSACAGSGGEDGDGCDPVSCPPAGIGSCEATRPSCSAALNGTGSARFLVQCLQ